MEKLKVESYSGFRAEERPLRFHIHEQAIEIISVEESWLTPEGRFFRVLGHDSCSYILEYKEADDTWTLMTQNLP